MKQIHIIDTTITDLILQEIYLANALVNHRGLLYTFYKMDLLLEHQNSEFKRFYADKNSFLQESNEIFRLHALLFNTFQKVRFSINKVIANRDQSVKYLTKDASFNILSLANQLYRLKSSHSDGPKYGKIYFLENQVSDLLI